MEETQDPVTLITFEDDSGGGEMGEGEFPPFKLLEFCCVTLA